MKNADRPAAPLSLAMNENECINIEEYHGDNFNNGLTKREHFAAMAMQGLMANPNSTISIHLQDTKANMEVAVQYADALLAELEK